MSAKTLSREEILVKVSEVLADVVDQDSLDLTEATTADEVPDWDSINHVKLLISLESELGFRFDTAETGDLKNVGQLISLIEKKLSE